MTIPAELLPALATHGICWACQFPVGESFRYCPNCGLWLMNAAPISVHHTQNLHSGAWATISLDDRTPIVRVPEWAQ